MLMTFVIAVLMIIKTEASRIFFASPTPSISHHIVFRPLIFELLKNHQLVLLTPDPIFKSYQHDNLTTIDVHEISYQPDKKFHAPAMGEDEFVRKSLIEMFDVHNKILIGQFELDLVKNLTKDKDGFDLLIIEAWLNLSLVWSHFFKTPVIQISSLGCMVDNRRTIGSPIHPLFNHAYSGIKGFNITFWEKLKALYKSIILLDFRDKTENSENISLKKLFGEVPTIRQLSSNVNLMLLNTNPLWELNAAVPNSVVYIGGIIEQRNEKLPEDLKKFLDNSNGTVYVSFGTNVQPSLLPKDKIQIFINVLSRLPYSVLWKWDQPDLPGRSANIRIGRWFPQTAVLRHPKLKLFITQGGLQSTDDALLAGVPLLGLPLLGDQWQNVQNYIRFGIGLGLEVDVMDEREVESKITEIIGNDDYRRNINLLRSKTRTSPHRPLDVAVNWIERTIRHGAEHVRCPAANMLVSEYYELELLGAVFAGFFGVFMIFVLVLNWFMKMICRVLWAYK